MIVLESIEQLEEFSTIALFSAVAVYSIAFVFYAMDLANRSGDAAVAAQGKGNGNGSGSGAGSGSPVYRSRTLRIGFSLTVLGFILHLAATVLRGMAAERLPFANMYEFALTATVSIVGIFLLAQIFVDLRFLGALITGITVLFLMLTKMNFYVAVVPLPPALDSYWLIIHILVAVLAVGFLTLSFGLSVLQLLQTRRSNLLKAAASSDSDANPMRFMRTLPNEVRLEDLSYRMAIIGFVFWTFTLIAGSIWAEAAWSRYWGWDTKEVWTFVIWVLYAGFIHARATRGWRGTRSAWLSVVAYSAIIFNYTIVNVFFKGLHAYSGL